MAARFAPVCYTCSHGLTPGPWFAWDTHRQEHAVWLARCAADLGASHLLLPTEAFARQRNEYSPAKLRDLVWMTRQAGMVPVVWADKWLYAQEPATVRAWLADAWATVHDLGVAWNLSNELDLTWASKPATAAAILGNLQRGRDELLARGVPAGDIWAGGATVAGTLEIERAVQPGVLHLTGWGGIERGVASGNVRGAVAADLRSVRQQQTTGAPLVMVECGWSTVDRGAGLSAPARDRWQADVLAGALQGAADAGVRPGLWTVADWPLSHDDRLTAEYGMFRVAAATGAATAKPAVQVWRSAVIGTWFTPRNAALASAATLGALLLLG